MAFIDYYKILGVEKMPVMTTSKKLIESLHESFILI